MTSQSQPNGGTGTGTILNEKQPPYLSSSPSTSTSTTTRRASSDEEKQDAGLQVDSAGAGDGSPAGETDKERWNFPRTNMRRVGACFYSFIIMGANDAAYGVSLPRCFISLFLLIDRRTVFYIFSENKKGNSFADQNIELQPLIPSVSDNP